MNLFIDRMLILDLDKLLLLHHSSTHLQFLMINPLPVFHLIV